MKKMILGLLFLSSALFSVEWVKDIDTALILAKKEHKNIMVLVEVKTADGVKDEASYFVRCECREET